MSKVKTNRIGDAIVLYINRTELHLNEVEGQVNLEVGEAYELAENILDLIIDQKTVDADLGADHYKGEKNL